MVSSTCVLIAALLLSIPFNIALPELPTHTNLRRDSCAPEYVECAPPGATGSGVPPIGSDVKDLYMAVLVSVQGNTLRRGVSRDLNLEVGLRGALPANGNHGISTSLPVSLRERQTSVQLCCAEGTQCLLLQHFLVPFCWDKFTTNFFLPFSSYGSLTTGNYTSPPLPDSAGNAPTTANLLSGNYTNSDGTPGNIYEGDEASKPNTSAMSSLMPTPWTSSGVGSPIPASSLGGVATWMTIIPGTTMVASTVSGNSVPGTTIPPTTSTITGFASPIISSSSSTMESSSSEGVAAITGAEGNIWLTSLIVTVAGTLCAILRL